nr:TIGR01620 family protein [Fertoeibacter niger]
MLLDWEGESDPGLALPVPEALTPEVEAMQMAARISTPRGSSLGRFALWAFGAMLSFVLSVAAYDFVAGLLERNTILGTIAFVLIGLAALAALMLAGREWLAYLRLVRLDSLRERAVEARLSADLKGARAVVGSLETLYANRADLRWGQARLKERQAEVFDADGLLAMAETELLTPLDQAARREIESAARQVALVTAVVPLAFADVAAALFANLRMVRRIAEIYGGRAGNFGSWRLLRRVFGYLIATGAMAIGDDLIGSVAGGGLLTKVSRRFGEGVINGALTARVGVAAMELCRPLPFVAAPRPKVQNLVSRALAGLIPTGGAKE